MAVPRKISKYSYWEFYFDDVRWGFRRSLQQEKQSFKVCQDLRCPHEEGLLLKDLISDFLLDPYITTKRMAKTLIRLGGCPDWSES